MTQQIEALKQALEAYLCREMPAGTIIGDPKWWVPKIAMAIREALAHAPTERDQPAQQTWNYKETGRNGVYTPAQQQEPVAWITNKGKGWLRWHRPEDSEKNKDSIPLYTSPQPSKPLTDEQIMEMYNEPRSDAEMLEFARAIEAAHGIKGDA